MEIKELQEVAFKTAKERGLYNCVICDGVGQIHDNEGSHKYCSTCEGTGRFFDVYKFLTHIMKEVSELVEAYDKGKWFNQNIRCTPKAHNFKEQFEKDVKNTIEDELADIMIITANLSKYLGVDLDRHIRLKLEYNKLRSYQHKEIE